MNNNNVFLQLREQDENISVNSDRQNGNFNINLKRPLILNEGDELLINKAVIDTRTLESDKIILENDINIEISFAYYLVNDNITHRRNPNGDILFTNADLDYELYVLAVPTAPGQDTKVYELRQVKFINANTPGKSSQWKDWTATFSYIDVKNQSRTVDINMSLEDPKGDGVNNWTSINKTFAIARVEEFLNTTNAQILLANGIYGDRGTLKLTVIEDDEVKGSFAPYIESTQITLKAGDYNYSDFADRINQEITFINSNQTLSDVSPGGNNTLLLNSGHPIYDAPAPNLGLYEQGAIWIRSTDGAKGFKLEPLSVVGAGSESQVYFGTNQFVLLFDDITNRFYFKYLNMPIYEGGSGNEAIKFEKLTAPGSGNSIKLINKSSGILIDSIITTDTKSGVNLNLFNSVLGFSTASLHPSYSTVNTTTLTGSNARSFKCILNDGLNTTGGLSSLDTIVQKKAPDATPPALPAQNLYKFTPPDLTALGYILIDQQNEIYAEKAVGLGASLSFGYYIIAIDGLQGDFITRYDIKNNIFAIISRYYSSNNYTVGSPEDAIIYTHRGNPQILNNLNVRILDGNFRIIPNLGIDNTIFLQHRKAKVPLDMIQQLEQQEQQKTNKKD